MVQTDTTPILRVMFERVTKSITTGTASHGSLCTCNSIVLFYTTHLIPGLNVSSGSQGPDHLDVAILAGTHESCKILLHTTIQDIYV